MQDKAEGKPSYGRGAFGIWQEVSDGMKRSKITVAVGVLLGGLAVVCGGRAAARQEAAARANAQQVQELLAAARDLDLPVGIELEAVQICHQPVTPDCWQTYVFVVVRTDAAYEELKAQLENPPRYLTGETTPLKVLAWDTCSTADWAESMATPESARAGTRWVLSWLAPAADSGDRQLQEGPVTDLAEL